MRTDDLFWRWWDVTEGKGVSYSKWRELLSRLWSSPKYKRMAAQ